MNLMFTGILSVIFMLIIFIINIAKGTSIPGVLLRTLIGTGVIFGIIAAVQFVLSSILNIDFSAAKDNDEASPGTKVDYTVGDDDVEYDPSQSSEQRMEINEDEYEEYSNESYEDSKSYDSNDAVAFQESDFSNLEKIDEYDDNIENYEGKGYDSSGYDIKSSNDIAGKDKEEIINSKLGFNASVEDLAKAVRTTLKRE